jgi:hypothetical protein
VEVQPKACIFSQFKALDSLENEMQPDKTKYYKPVLQLKKKLLNLEDTKDMKGAKNKKSL